MVRQNLQLLPTGTIVLKVVDEEGKPIPGVRFWFRDENNRYLGYAQPTNNAGITTSASLRMGSAMVQAYHGTYVVDKFPVDIQSGKTVTVDVVMQAKDKKK